MRAFGMLVLVAAVGCGDDGDGGGIPDGEPLTCAWVHSDDNCFDAIAVAMVDCMARGGDAALVDGDFDAAAAVCTDETDPARRAVWDPPKPTDSLVDHWYEGSVTLWNGELECGTLTMGTAGGASVIEVEREGERAHFEDRTELMDGPEVAYAAFDCGDGLLVASNEDVGGCWSAMPGVYGSVSFGTHGLLTLDPPGGPQNLLSCTLQEP
jgi:hypothetical protein